MSRSYLFLLSLFSLSYFLISEQNEPSVARLWNEVLLSAIRTDYARPTVHARNLFHTSIAMYDAWAVYDDRAETYLLGNTVGEFTCPFEGISTPRNTHRAREEAISYAMYRLLHERFRLSPGARTTIARIDAVLKDLGYDKAVTGTDYSTGLPANLGNYIAQCMIDFGLQDGANEPNQYANQYYKPVNPPLDLSASGNSDIVDPNRWQPLRFEVFIDQSGNAFPGAAPPFVSPEWGAVSAFALDKADLSFYERDGYQYSVYFDPGAPPYLDLSNQTMLSNEYKWGFVLVAIWSSHLDPSDGVMWEISPASIGNLDEFPQTLEAYRGFYDLLGGGDPGKGHAINPHTGKPYAPQWVPRADYARALAEFWADGPDSETPPGHWFTILNYVNDHPLFEKRFRGQGPVLTICNGTSSPILRWEVPFMMQPWRHGG